MPRKLPPTIRTAINNLNHQRRKPSRKPPHATQLAIRPICGRKGATMPSSSEWKRSPDSGSMHASDNCRLPSQHDCAVRYSTHYRARHIVTISRSRPSHRSCRLGAGISGIALNALPSYRDNTNNTDQSIGAVFVMQASCCLLRWLSSGPQYRLGSARRFATVVSCAQHSSFFKDAAPARLRLNLP